MLNKMEPGSAVGFTSRLLIAIFIMSVVGGTFLFFNGNITIEWAAMVVMGGAAPLVALGIMTGFD